MTAIAYVTKTGGDSILRQNDASGRAAYNARKVDGTDLGNYADVYGAQRAVERSINAGNRLEWRMVPANGFVEQWVADNRAWTPLMLPGVSSWWVGDTLQAGAIDLANDVIFWNDSSLNKVVLQQPAAAQRFGVITSGTLGGHRAAILPIPPTAQYMEADSILERPFRIDMVVEYGASGAPSQWAFSTVGADPMFLGVSNVFAPGRIRYEDGVATLNGSTALVPGTVYVLSLIKTLTTAAIYLNFNLEASGPAVASDATAIRLSDPALPWYSLIAEAVIWDATTSPAAQNKLASYWLNKYGFVL